MKQFLFSAFLFFVLYSCNPNYDMIGMFNGTSEKVDKRFSESMQWNSANNYFNEYNELIVDDDYQIFVYTDTHVDSTNRNTIKFYDDVKTAKTEKQSTFAIHLGDLINGKNNFAYFSNSVGHDSLKPFKDSTFYVLGNHDIYFNQWAVFKKYFHTSVYWFCTKSKRSGHLLDLFICLDSAEGTLGNKQLSWLKGLLKQKMDAGFRHKIILTHTNLFNNVNVVEHPSNYPIEETYLLTDLFTQYGIDMVWCGHEHNHSERQYGGVKYIVLATMQDTADIPEYMIVQMGESIKYNTVRF